jgi:glycosyltransferase A (GT-A) superfamily protein (DUF2064 family)
MNAVVLFARSPEREAAAKGMRSAAPLFRALVAAWLTAARRLGARPLIACAPEDRETLARIAPDVERGWIEQRGATFGARVVHVAAEAFARGFDGIVLTAIDAPPASLARALDSLLRGIPVLAPARDGGVNFIGLPRGSAASAAALLNDLTAARCRAFFTELLILEATTDIDSQASLAAARLEWAWQGFFRSASGAIGAPAAVRRGARRLFRSRAPPAA